MTRRVLLTRCCLPLRVAVHELAQLEKGFSGGGRSARGIANN